MKLKKEEEEKLDKQYGYSACCRKKKIKLTQAQRDERKMAAWTSRVKKKKTDTQYKSSRKQGWQGEPEPYSTIEIEIPTI